MPITPKPVTVHGVEYPSIKDAAEAYGIALGTVKARRAKGADLETALTTTASYAGNSKPVTVHGVEYPSIKDAAEACGIALKTVHTRRRKGADLETALTTAVFDRGNPQPVVIDGQEFPSITAAARELGVNHKFIRKVVDEHGGHSPAPKRRAHAKRRARPPMPTPVVVFGWRYKSWAAMHEYWYSPCVRARHLFYEAVRDGIPAENLLLPALSYYRDRGLLTQDFRRSDNLDTPQEKVAEWQLP